MDCIYLILEDYYSEQAGSFNPTCWALELKFSSFEEKLRMTIATLFSCGMCKRFGMRCNVMWNIGFQR